MTPTQGPQDWEIESDLHTLMKAEEIKGDPDRIARAKQFAARKAAEMAKMAGKSHDEAASMVEKGFRRLK